MKRLLIILLLLVGGQDGFAESMTPLQINEEPFFMTSFHGDFDEIETRRVIRFLVPYSRTFFFLDGATPKGLIYDKIKAFEKTLNEKLRTENIQIHAVVIPTDRRDLIPHLLAGKGDVAAGNLTITEERLKEVDFTDPFFENVREVLVCHSPSPNYDTIFELAGKTVTVRPKSSYYNNLVKINTILHDFECKPIKIEKINEPLEDEDILELVNEGIIQNTMTDEYKADFWAKILPNIHVDRDIVINEEGKIAWAIRKSSPRLKKELNAFIENHKQGTLAGNILFRKYLKNTGYITKNFNGTGQTKYQELIPLFKKYGEIYNFDHFLLIALAYQESKLDQDAKSDKGAVGIMQVLPSTAADPSVNVDGINTVENNIKAGTIYLRHLADTYFPASEDLDQTNRILFTFAAYNAGPNKINSLRKKAKSRGYNPNIWFHNVEILAAEEIGRETVTYVSNILKYYVAYNLLDKARSEVVFPIKGQRKAQLGKPSEKLELLASH